MALPDDENALAARAERKQGPRQIWTWSRVDGSIQQRRVRPSRMEGCWVEDWPNGFQQWPNEALCDTPEEAAQQARVHFQRILSCTQAVLARLG